MTDARDFLINDDDSGCQVWVGVCGEYLRQGVRHMILTDGNGRYWSGEDNGQGLFFRCGPVDVSEMLGRAEAHLRGHDWHEPVSALVNGLAMALVVYGRGMAQPAAIEETDGVEEEGR